VVSGLAGRANCSGFWQSHQAMGVFRAVLWDVVVGRGKPVRGWAAASSRSLLQPHRRFKRAERIYLSDGPRERAFLRATSVSFYGHAQTLLPCATIG